MKKGGRAKSASSMSYSYKEPLHEKPIFNYALALISITALVVGVVALANVNDLKKTLFPETIPLSDFFAKLNAHPEMQGLQDEQPVGGQIDAASLATLQQQFPDVYSNAKVGDFLLRFSTKLIIYDYNNDLIINAVDLTQ